MEEEKKKQNIFKEFKEKLKDESFQADVFTNLAFLIIFITTLTINIRVAFYILAFEFLIKVAIIVFPTFYIQKQLLKSQLDSEERG